MKIKQLNERFSSDYDASPDTRRMEDEVDEMESAYAEIALLNQAFEEKNFGVLIGKRGMLTDTDLREIKRKLSNIVRNNPIIDSSEVKRGRDGDESLHLLARTIGHGLEATGLAAISAGLAAVAVMTAPTVVGTGLASVGSALSAMGVKHQLNLIQSLQSLSKTLELVQTYEKLDVKPVRTSPSTIKKVTNWFLRKDEKDIRREAIKRVKKSSKKAQMKMQKNLRGFPKYVEYKERDGEIKQYPIINFFDNI